MEMLKHPNRKAHTGGTRGVDLLVEPPSVSAPNHEWRAFYLEMRKNASTDKVAERWAERAKHVLQDRGVNVEGH